MSEVRKCDACGATASGIAAGGWLGVTLGPFACPGDRGGQRLADFDRNKDFCTHACLASWAQGRTGEAVRGGVGA